MTVSTLVHSGRQFVSVIVPTLNEVQNVDSFLSRIVAALDGVAPFEIVVVGDDSTDSTQEHVRTCAPDSTVRRVSRDDVQDLEGAIMRGIDLAQGDVIVVIDPNLSYPPEAIPKLVEPILDESQDIAVGSRNVEGSTTIGWSLLKRITSRAAALLATPFTDVRDPISGFYAARRCAFVGQTPDKKGCKVLLEILASHSDSARICEVPIEFSERELGTSKLGGGVVAAYIKQLIKLSGTTATGTTAARFAIVGALGVAVDLSLFTFLSAMGITLGGAHIGSFLVATLFNYILNDLWSFRHSRDDGRLRLTLGRFCAFFAVCLAALFVRGGVIATGMEIGMPPILAVLVAIAIASGINFVGSALFVFASSNTAKATIRWRLVAAGIVVYSLVLRIAYIGAVDLLPEEAYYWDYAKHLDFGYLDHPPMIAWLIALTTQLFGDSEIAVRLPALFCWVITMGFMGALTNRIAGRSAAFATCALLAILPFFFICGLVSTPDCPLMAAWAAALYFLHRAISNPRWQAWIGFGLAIGVGLLSKYTIALLGPAALCIMFLDRDARRWFFTPYPYIAALIALVLFSPVIVWNAQHEWSSFVFQTVRRLNDRPQFGLFLLVGSIIVLLSPVGFTSTVRAIASSRQGLGGIAKKDRRFLLVAALVPLAVFITFSIRHEPNLNWTGPVWLALLPLMSLDLLPAVARISRNTPTPFVPIAWKVTVVGAFLLFGVGLHYLAIGIPGIGYPKRMPMPVAWQELGNAVEAIEDDIEQQRGGKEPLIVGMDHYFLASELAFYRTKAERSSGHDVEGLATTSTMHLLDHPGLMYEQWFPEDDLLGVDCILIAFDRSDINYQGLRKWFDELSPIETLTLTKNNQFIHSFYWRVGTRYHHPLETATVSAARTPLLN